MRLFLKRPNLKHSKMGIKHVSGGGGDVGGHHKIPMLTMELKRKPLVHA